MGCKAPCNDVYLLCESYMLSWDEGGYGHTTANELSCTVEIFDDMLTPSNQITKLLIIFISFMTMVHFRDVGLM